MATHATTRGDKVCIHTGEGGVLLNGFDREGYVMVTITWSPRRERLGRAEIYHNSDLYDPSPDDARMIPSRPPTWFWPIVR